MAVKKSKNNSIKKRKKLSTSGKEYNFKTRKSIHVSMLFETHKLFKLETVKKGLSMQAAVEEFATRVAQKDPVMMELLDILVEQKKTGERELAVSDAQSIYDMIENDDFEI